MAGARRPPILQGSLTASSLIRTIRGLEHDVPAAARPLDRRAGRVLGRTGPFPGLVPGAREYPRKPARRHPSLVRRWPPEQRLPGPRPADRGGARRTDRADLRLAGDRHPGPLQLPAAARRSGAPGRRPAGPRGRQGRPGDHLHADGAAGGHGDARLRAPGRGAFGGVRWLRSLRAGPAHRRRHAEAGAHRFLRAGVRPGDRIQAAGGQGPRTGDPPACPRHGLATPAGARAPAPGPRPGLAGLPRRRRAGRSAAGGQRRSAVHHVHLGHHR